MSVSSDTDPGSAYIFNCSTGKAELLYRSRPKLNSEWLAPMKPVRYKARDGMSIPAYLVTPKGIPSKNLPAVMLIHGGPWARVMWGYNGEAQYLANRGYAVLIPNFRGSTGYGKKFLNAGMGISGGNFLIAETGTLVLVTNEGNGRMCTTMPDLHVAVVGIDKVIPDWESLTGFLKLLARSATGQKLFDLHPVHHRSAPRGGGIRSRGIPSGPAR